MPTLDPRQALVEAELLLQRLARGKCWACCDRPAVVLIWDGVPEANPDACRYCGSRPDHIIDVVHGYEAPAWGR